MSNVDKKLVNVERLALNAVTFRLSVVRLYSTIRVRMKVKVKSSAKVTAS